MATPHPADAPNPLSGWITTHEAAERVGVSEHHIRRLFHQGKLQAVRTPVGFFISLASVQAFMANRPSRGGARPARHR